MATVSGFVIFFFVFAVLGLVLVPAASYSGLLANGSVSFLVSGLVVGYVFAGKIREESRMRSIAKIVVLVTFVVIIVTLMVYSTVESYHALVDENLPKMYNTSSWTTTDWYSYETWYLYLTTAFNAVIGLVLVSIGLYLGSMRKPSAKTKE
jgi:ABC-type transport system involved in multi-copper enzyme maturation permease subunit